MNSVNEIGFAKLFDLWPLPVFPGKNSANIADSNHIFPGKGRGDKAFTLTYLAEVFLHYYLFIWISAISVETGDQS